MKNQMNAYTCVIFASCLFIHNSTQSMGAVAKVVSKGVDIAGKVASVVDVAMNIANVGVTLWGNDKDKARMAKGMAISGIITSLARGDLQGAQASADATNEAFKGSLSSIQYQPLMANELADADIVAVEEPPVIQYRSVPIRQYWSAPIGGGPSGPTADQRTAAQAQRKTVSIDDLKIAQFSEAKNQLVFMATGIPQVAGQSLIYTLLNGKQILFTTQSVQNNTANIVIKEFNGTTATQIGNIQCSLDQLIKGLFVGTTNGELSIFFKDGNLIKKTILIKNMNQ